MDPTYVFRGQLYEGDRNPIFGGDNFQFGEAEYWTTDFADGSGYSKANSFENHSLGDNIERQAKIYGMTYSQVKAMVEESGDGIVKMARVTPQRPIRFGDGNLFPYLGGENDRGTRALDYALVMCDIPASRRELMVRQIQRFNHDPVKAMSVLRQNGASQALRHYAVSYNADLFIICPDIAPVASHDRERNIMHYVVLDTSCLEHICQVKPLTLDTDVFVPNKYTPEESKQILDEYLERCETVSTELIESAEFELSLKLAVNAHEPPKETPKPQVATVVAQPKL